MCGLIPFCSINILLLFFLLPVLYLCGVIVTSFGVSGHVQYIDLLLICACVISVLGSVLHTTLLLTGEVELVSVEMFINIDLLGIYTVNIFVHMCRIQLLLCP